MRKEVRGKMKRRRKYAHRGSAMTEEKEGL
jgi:hypothetical protein